MRSIATYKIPIIQIDDVYIGTSTNHKLRISDILRIKGMHKKATRSIVILVTIYK